MLGGGKLSYKLEGFEYFRNDRVSTCCAGKLSGSCSRCYYEIRFCFLVALLSQDECTNEYRLAFETNNRYVSFGATVFRKPQNVTISNPIEIPFTRWTVSIFNVFIML